MTADVHTVACTVVARNYLPYARVLAEGWRRFHGSAPFYTLVIDQDEAEGTAGEDLEVLVPADLGLPPRELAQMRGIYGVAELTTAMKPSLFRFLLDQGADAVVFLDSDTDVHASLLDVGELAVAHGVLLLPHVVKPIPLDGGSPSEFDLQKYGTFNSGFIAVGDAGRPFLDWWASRLRRDCLFCEEMGLHADQRWLEWVPLYFDHQVLRDPGLSTAHWNLHERAVGWADESFTVDGQRLRTFHFAGFDPERPTLLTWYERPYARYDIHAEPHLLRLCQEYAQKLLEAGYREFREVPYAYGTSVAGTPLGAWERQAYREMLLAAEARGGDVPDPFNPARSAEFERMIADPRSAGLLSEAALARIRDARLARPVAEGQRWARLRGAVGLGRRFLRRLPARRHSYMPYPLPSDRTQREYAAAPRG